PARAADPVAQLYRVEGPAGLTGYGLGAIDGKVRLVKAPANRDWVLVYYRDKGYQIRRRTGSQLDKHYGWYLSYDVEGKSKAVVLTKKPGPGSWWKVSPHSKRTSISAKSGKLEGWDLDVGEAAQTVKDGEGRTSTAYSAQLSHNARRPPLF